MVDKRRRDVIVPARFDDEVVARDIERLSSKAASALAALRREIERDGGIKHSRLKACQAEGRDATKLAGCVKTYVPWPTGPWGIVFQGVAHPERPWGLRALAYGHRHPTGPGKPSVYHLAHERLIEITVRDLRNESAGSDPT